MVLRPPLDAGRQRIAVPIVVLGIEVTLFRNADNRLSEEDQVVFHRVSYDPSRSVLPFGLDGRAITPHGAERVLGDDTAGGRSADLERADTRISYFLPEDARVVELTFAPSMVGLTRCQVLRLGGEIPYREVDTRFGPNRRGRQRI